jgi:hypothetical protein
VGGSDHIFLTENEVSALSLQVQTITPLQTGALQNMGVPHASCHTSLHNNTPWTVTSESKLVLCADDTSMVIYDLERELFQNFISDVFDSFNILFKRTH